MKRMGFRRLLERGKNGLEALLEVAPETRAGQQRGGVEREHFCAGQRFRHVRLDQTLREAFGHGGLADAGISDQHRAVLATAAEDLERALHLALTADQRVEQTVGGPLATG